MNSEKGTESSSRRDSYSSTISGLGTVKDKTKHIGLNGSDIFDDQALTTMYDTDSLVASIVDGIPEDGMRNGWLYKNDEDQKIEKECKRLKLSSKVEEAWKLARLYRGAIIVMVTKEGLLEDPLPANGNITQLRVYSAARLQMDSNQIVIEPSSPYFEDVEWFRVIPKSGGDNFKVHRSRCLVFKGVFTPDYLSSFYTISHTYFGLSVIQKLWERIKYLGSSEQGVATMMSELSVGKYKLPTLSSILAQNKATAVKQIMTRLEAMNMSKSIINAVILGKDEDWTRDTLNLTGVSDILDRQMTAVSAGAKMPATKLFGRSPAGMNATGESDTRNYYDQVRSSLENYIRPEIEKVIQYVGVAQYKGSPDQYGIEDFNSLWQPTEKEKAEIMNIESQAYEKYVNMGVVDAQYVQEIEFPDFVPVPGEEIPEPEIEGQVI